MIRYALICAGEHSFESWFRDSAAFDALAETDAITCPICGSARVSKALMAPSIVTSRRKAAGPVVEVGSEAQIIVPPTQETASPRILLDERERRLRDMLRRLHGEIIAKADNVGRGFAEEARRIHQGKAAPRSIYGEASGPEVNDLLEDGVPLMPMPSLPDDNN